MKLLFNTIIFLTIPTINKLNYYLHCFSLLNDSIEKESSLRVFNEKKY